MTHQVGWSVRSYKGEKIVVLGASRGLGRALVEELIKQSPDQILLVSRKLSSTKTDLPQVKNFEYIEADLTKDENVSNLMRSIASLNPHRIFYVAGGGAYGTFNSREWKDHDWTLRLNFLTPAKIIHALLGVKREPGSNLHQIMIVGSSVAGLRPDPMAASYSAAKHALVGLISSLQGESHSLDLRLFNPGYINTSLLPKNAKPRHDGSLVHEAHYVADYLLTWLLDDSKRNTNSSF